MREELGAEETERKADEYLAQHLARFEAEPVDAAWSAVRAKEIEATFAATEFSSLVQNVECRWTMCRVELAATDASLTEIWRVADFRYGGTSRKRPDGTVVLLAGRQNYPFHEVNYIRPP